MVKKMLLTIAVCAMALANVDAAQYRLKANPAVAVMPWGFHTTDADIKTFKDPVTKVRHSAEDVEEGAPITLKSRMFNAGCAAARTTWNTTCAVARGVNNYGIKTTLVGASILGFYGSKAAGTLLASRPLKVETDYPIAAYTMGCVALGTAYLGYKIAQAAKTHKPAAEKKK